MELTYQLPNGTYDGFHSTVDLSLHTLALTSFQGARQPPMTFRQADADALTLDGTLDGTRVHMRLRRVDLADYPLFGPGFYWVHDGAAE